jgi:hypothetical protein
LRQALHKLAPLAFELRDDLIYSIPPDLRNDIVSCVIDGELLRDHPEAASQLRSLRRKGGKITVTDYTAPDGQSLFLNFRRDFDGGKSFLPVHCYADVSDRLHVECRYPPGLLPLYNWAALVDRPNAPVLVPEGEKAADAASILFPDHVATTSACGAFNANRSDWGPLHDRDVIIFRDHDEAGLHYETAAAAHAFAAGARSVRKVVLSAQFPTGWDLADELPEGVTQTNLREALANAVEVRWADVKAGLSSPRQRASQPPFRLPDGLFAGRKVMLTAIGEALDRIDPGCSRMRWMGALGSIYHALGDAGLEIADGWSRRDSDKHQKYREGEVQQIFESFSAAVSPQPLPVLALFRMAMKEERERAAEGKAWEPDPVAMALAHVAEFEARHRKITQGDNITIGIQSQLPDGSYRIRHMSEKNADSYYKAKKAPNLDGSRTGIFPLWQNNQLLDPVELVFKPAGDLQPGELNLFQGFAIQPTQGAGSYAQLRDHIDAISLANGDSEGFLWKLMAYRLQNLGTFVPCALILIGPEGGGKTTVTSVLARILAPYSITLSDPEKFVGRNNACLQGKLFVQLEEMILGKNENYDSRLKHYVTSDTLDVEEKWKAQWITENRLFIAMTANKKSVVRITEHSRRFAVYDVADRFRGDQTKREEYFGKLWTELESGGLEALVYDLMHTDLEGFSPAEVPKTPLFLELAGVDADRDPLRGWFRELLERGELPETVGKELPWTAPIDKRALYNAYVGWCEGDGPLSKRSILSDAEWSKGLRRMLSGNLVSKRMMQKGKRGHFLYLPPHEDCCEYFESMFSCKLDRAPRPAQLHAVF